MSSSTGIYIRKKANPSLQNIEADATLNKLDGDKTESDVLTLEVEEESFEEWEKKMGCQLLFLGTTPTRRLEALPWSDDPVPLTKDIVKDIISYYEETIAESQAYKKNHIEQIKILEERITKSTRELYGLIDSEIRGYRSGLNEWDEEIEGATYYKTNFEFIAHMLDHCPDDYEIIYYKL